MKDLNGNNWVLKNKLKISDFNFPIKTGDILELELKPDTPTTLYSAQKVTNIEEDGTIRIECVNPKCTKKECTYLDLYIFEIPKVKVSTKYTKTQRLGGITF